MSSFYLFVINCLSCSDPVTVRARALLATLLPHSAGHLRDRAAGDRHGLRGANTERVLQPDQLGEDGLFRAEQARELRHPPQREALLHVPHAVREGGADPAHQGDSRPDYLHWDRRHPR